MNQSCATQPCLRSIYSACPALPCPASCNLNSHRQNTHLTAKYIPARHQDVWFWLREAKDPPGPPKIRKFPTTNHAPTCPRSTHARPVWNIEQLPAVAPCRISLGRIGNPGSFIQIEREIISRMESLDAMPMPCHAVEAKIEWSLSPRCVRVCVRERVVKGLEAEQSRAAHL